MSETKTVIQWLLDSPEPWTRYRTRVDLLGQPEDAHEVQADRVQMVSDPRVQALIVEMAAWGGQPIKRHNDAGYPIYKLSTLADFGLRVSDPGMAMIIDEILAHQSPQGAFQTLVNIPKAFGGTGEDLWAWMVCDAPTLLYTLLAMGLGSDPRLQRAVQHLASLVEDNGYRCKVDPGLGKFRGPGSRADPCPIANVYALKALSQVPEMLDSPAAHKAAEMLLGHWASPEGLKYYLFGVGSDFRKLKYPFVWYDILHVTDVLSRFPFVRADLRFQRLLSEIAAQADGNGRYMATSMYQSWKGWSFADKKHPSPWLTFLALRFQASRG
jgi:hypothetical protein